MCLPVVSAGFRSSRHVERTGDRVFVESLWPHLEAALHWIDGYGDRDGDKRPCQVRTSNAGQCLFTGIVSLERARCVARTLLRPESFSGWGIRTVATPEARYNPMAYHNGSVWPHDNGLIAQGLARYGMGELALQIWTGMFEAGRYFDLHRMPELFCGFPQAPGEGPTLYPIACAPQSWSAASVFLLFQACLGLEINGPEAQVYFTRPHLPASLGELRIHNLEGGRGNH
jgi:glycogen debranching enzyme